MVPRKAFMNVGRLVSGTHVAALAGLVVLCFGQPAQAGAMVNLKQVQIAGQAQIELLFDAPVSMGQIRTEFFNDVVQLSISEATVYPAKISTVNSALVSKVFAYQYTPKLVRCRFTVKGKAESFKDRFQLSPSGKVLSVKFDEPARQTSSVEKDKIASQAAKAEEKQVSPRVSDPEEQKLLEKILHSPNEPSEKALAAASPAHEKNRVTVENPPFVSKPLTGGKPLASPVSLFGKTGIVIGLMLLVFFVARKVLKGNNTLSRIASKSLGVKPKMIEVLSNHYLGPKKSISVVKIAGRVLVLGVTNDSVNLITQLPGDGGDSALNMDLGELEDLGLRISDSKEVRAQHAMKTSAFKEVLEKEKLLPTPGVRLNAPSIASGAMVKPSIPPALPPNASKDNVRARIRSRLEGLKPL